MCYMTPECAKCSRRVLGKRGTNAKSIKMLYKERNLFLDNDMMLSSSSNFMIVRMSTLCSAKSGLERSVTTKPYRADHLGLS